MPGFRNTATADILKWLARNALGSFVTNHTPADAWNAYLVSVVGITSANKELEGQWLRNRIAALGATAPTGSTLSDLWRIYLQKKGHTGDLTDMFNQWLDHGTP
jgi:hypothetical protein